MNASHAAASIWFAHGLEAKRDVVRLVKQHARKASPVRRGFSLLPLHGRLVHLLLLLARAAPSVLFFCFPFSFRATSRGTQLV
eukprot:09212_5